jgi:hypothetical protein
LVEGIGGRDSSEGMDDWAAGRRKGSEPVGEAWLLEEISRWLTPAMLRKV